MLHADQQGISSVDLKVEGNGDDRVVEEGDNVTLLCGSFNFNQNIEWSYWKKSQFSAAQYGVTSKLTVSPLSFGKCVNT